MNLFQALILSAVEGFTEFLPISSTGHLILAEHFLKIPTTEFVKSFDIIIQTGAILAVVWLYWKKIISSKKLWRQTFIAFIPTGILGLVFYSFIKHFLLGSVVVTSASLLIGGLILLLLDRRFKTKEATQSVAALHPPKLLAIGLAQSVSMIPGVSRSAASIIGGLFVGLSRKEAVEFSFLLAIPTMLTATGLDLLKTGFSFTGPEIFLLTIGFLTSFITAVLAVRAFTSFVTHHDFTLFALYRILLAGIVFSILLR